MAAAARLRRQLLDYALGLPGAYLDHPWGEDVVKVGKKVFCFFGTSAGSELGIGMKLTLSQPLALAQPKVTPMRYGLGKAGWVSIRLGQETPFEMLREWIDESYAAVAPKRPRR